jgi:hypothetical protein
LHSYSCLRCPQNTLVSTELGAILLAASSTTKPALGGRCLVGQLSSSTQLTTDEAIESIPLNWNSRPYSNLKNALQTVNAVDRNIDPNTARTLRLHRWKVVDSSSTNDTMSCELLVRVSFHPRSVRLLLPKSLSQQSVREDHIHMRCCWDGSIMVGASLRSETLQSLLYDRLL